MSPPAAAASSRARHRAVERIPPSMFFMVSAVFHYLGPSFAVLLFARIEPLGVAWLRIATAAVVFVVWRRPWTFVARVSQPDRLRIVGLGCVLAAMNSVFYLAIARLPLSTVGAIEFLGPILLAAAGTRSSRNVIALTLAVTGVCLLSDVRLAGEPVGFLLAFINCALFMAYVVLGHRVSARDGIDRLALAMIIAAMVAFPVGIVEAAPAFASWILFGAAVAVGVSSSVIPYVADQLAMARLPRSTFALMLSILPATATVVGILVLHQFPTPLEIAGIGLVISGVALHRTQPSHDP